ncbi:hypothetical protein [Thalassospira xiamenensis]|uniref:hypothetical protein n=1 Tax=Thalassospira xiamenensis TaxID=220697 RepID=UPI000DEE09A0|nr:hypothetical protein [Thalassospira xiamenensis]RCK32232.1 hypothetical protein TH24_22390 [Thalassospira xiamenensis]
MVQVIRLLLVIPAIFCSPFFVTFEAQARNGMKFEGFQANVHDILSGIGSYCQRNPGQMAFAVSSDHYRDELFREACGTGLAGQMLPFGDWGVIYQVADYPDGQKSIFGVGKHFSLGTTEYLLVIGEEMFVRFRGQEKQEIALHSSAILNARDGASDQWVEVINYVAANGNGWNVRSGSISDFSVGQRIADDNTHAIWQRIVAADFGKLVRSMKDMNWPD